MTGVQTCALPIFLFGHAWKPVLQPQLLVFQAAGIEEFLQRQAAARVPVPQLLCAGGRVLDMPGFEGDFLCLQPFPGFLAGRAFRIFYKQHLSFVSFAGCCWGGGFYYFNRIAGDWQSGVYVFTENPVGMFGFCPVEKYRCKAGVTFQQGCSPLQVAERRNRARTSVRARLLCIMVIPLLAEFFSILVDIGYIFSASLK